MIHRLSLIIAKKSRGKNTISAIEENNVIAVLETAACVQQDLKMIQSQ